MELSQSKPLVHLCDELLQAVEELLQAGLTTASKSTIERIDVSFKEASRMKLLRLGSTLRIANEEIARFQAGSQQFSARRLVFFLSRTWILAHGIRRAIDAGDEKAFQRLMVTPPTEVIGTVPVVTLGVGKRVVPGAFAAFEFRLRAVAGAGPLAKGDALVWSCVFPLRKDLDLPAEAYLHLPQKQKFKPSLLLEKNVVTISECAISRQPESAPRLVLAEKSTVKAAAAYRDWPSLVQWDMRRSRARLGRHQPTPLDLEVELQEEIVLDDWSAGPLRQNDDGYDTLAITAAGLPLEARLDHGPSGEPLRDRLTKIAEKSKRPPLFGTMHYESCRLMFQPLSAFTKDGIDYLTISPDKVSQAELVKAMKFT
jgi:hypothetical protein